MHCGYEHLRLVVLLTGYRRGEPWAGWVTWAMVGI
jgi:hypothetical protein